MRTKCIVCGASFLDEPLFVCKKMPARSQDLPTRENVDNDKPIDFNLCQCSGCGLVQFDCEPVSYYRDSTRAGERSNALIKMRREQYKHLIDTYGLRGKKILEVGAGKGGFLKTLKEIYGEEVKGVGIENNSDFVRIAREKEGVNVIQGNPENPDMAIPEGPFDAFMSFAYPARLVSPDKMLQGVSKNLVDGGVGLIQVASLEHLMKQGGFFDITPDHIAYYDKNTLQFLLQKNGFNVLETGEIGGIYIYAIVQKRKPYALKELWADIEPMTSAITKYVEYFIRDGKKVAVWCAGHFAFTILSIAGLGKKIAYIIDNAVFKQGRFAPASHIPIVGPEHFKDDPVDVVLILGPLYIDEIVCEIREKCSTDVRIATFMGSELKEL